MDINELITEINARTEQLYEVACAGLTEWNAHQLLNPHGTHSPWVEGSKRSGTAFPNAVDSWFTGGIADGYFWFQDKERDGFGLPVRFVTDPEGFWSDVERLQAFYDSVDARRRFEAALEAEQAERERELAENIPTPAEAAMNVIERFGGIEGDHHRAWVIDQVARALMGADYDRWVVAMCDGDEGPNTYDWDVGIAP